MYYIKTEDRLDREYKKFMKEIKKSYGNVIKLEYIEWTKPWWRLLWWFHYLNNIWKEFISIDLLIEILNKSYSYSIDELFTNENEFLHEIIEEDNTIKLVLNENWLLYDLIIWIETHSIIIKLTDCDISNLKKELQKYFL